MKKASPHLETESKASTSVIMIFQVLIYNSTAMKRLFIIMSAVAMVLSGCVKEEFINSENLNQKEGTRTIIVTLEEEPATRTTFNDSKDGLVWETGDQVAYFIDNDGTRQVATVVNGAVSITMDGSAHTVKFVYPVSTDAAYNNVTYANYPKNNISSSQVQSSLDKFSGKNLPITGTASIAAGSGNTNVTGTYSVSGAAILAFTIDGAAGVDENISSVSVYTTDLSGLMSATRNFVTITFPSGTKVSDLQGKTVYAVVKSGDHDVVKVSMISATKTYYCATDITTKGSIIGFDNSEVYRYKWDIGNNTTSYSGLLVGLEGIDGGALKAWDGTAAGLQTLGLTSGGTYGSDSDPYSVKIATGGAATLSSDNMTGLKSALDALNDDSRIALDMSMAKVATLENAFSPLTELYSFIFPIGDNAYNITTLSGTFTSCYNLVSVSAIPVGVTNMEETFYNCHDFDQSITIPNGVTDISGLFNSCYDYNKAIEIPSSVTDMQNAFYSCYKLNSLVTFAEGSQVETMACAFGNCSEFDQPVSIPSSTINIIQIFTGCSKFNKPVSIPSSVENMSRAFSDCPLFNQPVSIPSSVYDMSSAFSNCPALASTITINIGADKRIITNGSGYYDLDRDIDIHNMFLGSFPGNIDLQVTSAYKGDKFSNRIWYSKDGTDLANGHWTFKSVTGI